MAKKCKYKRACEQDQYVPACCVEEDGHITNSVHPYDVEEWEFCPFCGRRIKTVEESTG